MESSAVWTFTGGYYYLHKAVPVYSIDLLADAYAASEDPGELNRWITHVHAEPGSEEDGGELFERIEDTGRGTLWKVLPEHRIPVNRWESYRFSPLRDWFDPSLARHLPQGADFSPRIIYAGRGGD